MLNRCYNENIAHFVDYGGRGIQVCEAWRNSFQAFLDDMGEKPRHMTLDRIENNGNYEPGNCRWTTQSVQLMNRRLTRVGPVLSDRHFLSYAARHSDGDLIVCGDEPVGPRARDGRFRSRYARYLGWKEKKAA